MVHRIVPGGDWIEAVPACTRAKVLVKDSARNSG